MAMKYVPIFFDWPETTQDLNQENKGNLIDAIVEYASGEREQQEIIRSLMPVERVAFRFLCAQVDRVYEISGKRSVAGSKRTITESESKPQQTPAKPEEQSKPKQTRFIPPTVEEVSAYCRERNNKVDAEQFVAFYESKGWRIGNQSMKNWKSAIVTWEKRETDTKPIGKRVEAQNYTQRNYQQKQETPEEILRRLNGGTA